jgi:hypothetical protein
VLGVDLEVRVGVDLKVRVGVDLKVREVDLDSETEE